MLQKHSKMNITITSQENVNLQQVKFKLYNIKATKGYPGVQQSEYNSNSLYYPELAEGLQQHAYIVEITGSNPVFRTKVNIMNKYYIKVGQTWVRVSYIGYRNYKGDKYIEFGYNTLSGCTGIRGQFHVEHYTFKNAASVKVAD